MDADSPVTGLIIALAIVRALHFAACLSIAGVWIFDRLVAGNSSAWRRPAVLLLLIFTPLAAVTGAAWFVLVAAGMSDCSIPQSLRPGSLHVMLTQTRFGEVWMAHAAFGVAAAVAAGVWFRTGRGQWVNLILSIAVVGGIGWAGHGSTGPVPVVHLIADVIHLCAAAVWPGGLVPFAMVLWRSSRRANAGRLLEMKSIIRRFSTASLVAVGLLTATGLVDSVCLLGTIRALYTTPYGRVLVIKLLLFAGMIGLGAANRFVIASRLDVTRTDRRLLSNVIIEAVLGSGVVAAVGLLGLLEPGRN